VAELVADAGTSALRMLIVEDEALVALLIEDALVLHGHHAVDVVDTLAAALAAADRERPDLALCDVKLAAGEDGIAIAHALAERGIPCLFLSGNCPSGADHRLIVGCLEKPFRIDSLGLAVQAAYDAARGLRPTTLPSGMTLF